MLSDIEIARSIRMKPITDIAASLNIPQEDLSLYGKYKAKLPLSFIDKKNIDRSNLILVSAMSPTPAGEGKTTVSIGLSMALNKIGKSSIVALREPSLGPIFGIKGGAAGGGYSQVLPMEDINLHFTGDFSAVEKANNLLAALIDNNIQNKTNNLGINPGSVVWKRVMDMNDRSLRQIIIGLGGSANGVPRETGFDITAASELMAILCMAKDMNDLQQRIGNIFIGYTYDKQPVYCRDLKADGAMTVLMKEAIFPNLVQTTEHTPAILHGGPFANIAQGTNSTIATYTAMSLSEYVVTEAGFGFDLGGEKFLDLKCRNAGISPKVVVLSATVRALKYHGGIAIADLKKPDLQAITNGMENLNKHIENVRSFGLPVIVAINRFATDTDDEINLVKKLCNERSVQAIPVDVWAKGGEGAVELAEAVLRIAKRDPVPFKPLYELSHPIEKKIEKIAKNIYGASQIEYSKKAISDLKSINDLGLAGLPVCIAKTQKSLSDNPALLGAPHDFIFNIREIEIAAGAGFVIPISGEIMRMPGLPSIPSAEHIAIDDQGNIAGLF
ncbi:MAG: formate--tetrahydrofolate ligase [Bacteroidales bacterium]|nr:formate--tetrahydrofolate ligase [Bacteroidales bacterium]